MSLTFYTSNDVSPKERVKKRCLGSTIPGL